MSERINNAEEIFEETANAVTETEEVEEEVEEETTRIICPECGEVIEDEEDCCEYDGEFYHSDCLVRCDHCDEILGTQSDYDGQTVMTRYGDELWCENCVDTWAFYCEHCDTNYYDNDYDAYDVYDDNHWETWCGSCTDNNAFRCEECGEYYSWDYESNNSYICDNCYKRYCEDNEEYIWDYHTKPNPIFHETKSESEMNIINPYIGIELEIDKGGRDNDNAGNIWEVAYGTRDNSIEPTLLYMKDDGSINNGFEIISQPCTYNYHIESFPWGGIMSEAKDMGYRSHDTSTCGLHMHINRNFFGNDSTSQHAVIARIVYFCEMFYDEIVKFSRRKAGQLHWTKSYCNSHNINPKTKYKNPSDIQKGYRDYRDDCDRYRIVNLNNTNTIEFRIFRGTLKYSTFKATLQFVQTLCILAKNMSDEVWFSMDFSGLVNWGIKNLNFSELGTYCNERGIDLNKSTFETVTITLTEFNKKNRLLLKSDIPSSVPIEFVTGDLVTVSDNNGMHMGAYNRSCIPADSGSQSIYYHNLLTTRDEYTYEEQVEFNARPLTDADIEAGVYTIVYRTNNINNSSDTIEDTD